MLSDVALALDALLPEWREVVTYRAGPLLVLGAAGTGKTSLIEARFCWLVEQGVRPEHVVVEDFATLVLDVAALERGYRRPAARGHEVAVSVVAEPSRLLDLLGLLA